MIVTDQDPDGEVKRSGKIIFEIRNQNFCYIQVIVYDLSYLPEAAIRTKQVRYHEKIVENINQKIEKELHRRDSYIRLRILIVRILVVLIFGSSY